jgi:hypothetical protein
MRDSIVHSVSIAACLGSSDAQQRSDNGASRRAARVSQGIEG